MEVMDCFLINLKKNEMKMKNIATLSITLTIIFISCSTSKMSKADNTDLYKNEWTLTELNEKEIVPGSFEIPFLTFSKGDENRVSGNSSCNILNGTFSLEGKNKITFSQIASTRRACLEGDIEQEFLEMMNKTTGYQLTNNELWLLDGKDVIAKFKAGDIAISEVPSELNGVWKLNYITGKRIAFKGLYPDDIPTLAFKSDDPSNVGGNTSCNVFSSKMVITGSTINISAPHIMTMRACPGEGEQTFLNMLTEINKYTVSGDTLTLLKDDVAMMRFEKQ